MIGVKATYEYSSRVRRQFLEKLATLPWEEVSKNREASHYSMAGIMLHMINNEDWIVNRVIHEKDGRDAAERPPEDYTSVRMIVDHLDDVEARTRAYLLGVDAKELDRGVRFTLSSGATFDMTVEESLFQSFTEQLYHIGELIALLWEDDLEPPRMQWFHNRESLRLSDT
jgi:uncharacterized damage-inducible protein DinB